VATTECVLFGHDVELAGWRSRSRTRCECQRFPGSHCRRLPEGNCGLAALADDVALIEAEFSSSAWTHGDLPITVRLWLQDGAVTIEVSDAPRSPACAFLRERQRAARALKARPWQGGPWLPRHCGCFTRPRRARRRCQNRLIRPTSLLIGMILM
jgi:hypothetical protein